MALRLALSLIVSVAHPLTRLHSSCLSFLCHRRHMKPICPSRVCRAPQFVAQDVPGTIRLLQTLFVCLPRLCSFSTNSSPINDQSPSNDVMLCWVAQVRDFVRPAVLCTDMAQHSKLSKQLREAKATLAAAAAQRRQMAYSTRRSATSRAAVPQLAAQARLGRQGAAEQKTPHSPSLPALAGRDRQQGRSPAGADSGDAAAEVMPALHPIFT